MRSLPLLTASRLATWRRCPREHHFRYVLGRVHVSSPAQRLGTLVHIGLEAWWQGAGAVTAMRQAAGVDADPYDLARAEAMLIGYGARWGGERYEVLAVEAEFRRHLPQPDVMESGAPWLYEAARPVGSCTGPVLGTAWTLAGKLDALVRDSTGRVLIVEHKTTSEDISLGSAYWQRLRMDGQLSMYYLGALALGYEPAGVLYDVLVKPRTRPERASEQPRWTKGRRVRCSACIGPLPACPTCGGVGTIEIEPPHLYRGQRLDDESPEAYRERLIEEIARAPERYYARAEVVRLESERRQYLTELRQLAQQVATAPPLPNPDACHRFGTMCGYHPVCTGERRIDEYERLIWPHPELTEEGS